MIDWSSRYTILGRTLTLDEWSRDKLCMVDRATIEQRLGLGWNVVRAIMRPLVVEQAKVGRPPLPKKIKGVTPKGIKWQAQIKIDGVVHWLGDYDTIEEAARAYDSKVREDKLDRQTNYPADA